MSLSNGLQFSLPAATLCCPLRCQLGAPSSSGQHFFTNFDVSLVKTFSPNVLQGNRTCTRESCSSDELSDCGESGKFTTDRQLQRLING